MQLRKWTYGSLFLILLLILYISYENYRIVIIKEEIELKRLPEAFDGFTILLLSDLHEKRFGNKQERLVRQINEIEHDLIAIAGDMLNHDTIDPLPFFELLEGIKNQRPILFAKGNTDPEEYDMFTGEITVFGQELTKRGVTLLNKPFAIKKEEDTLFITSFQLFSRIQHFLNTWREHPDGIKREEYWRSIETFWKEVDDREVKIALTHYPVSHRLLEDLTFKERRIPDYDLILAGHYHGGQFRIPFYGALYVPEAVDGWFPPQEIVSGLQDYVDYKQYISRGLGASKLFGFLNFRLFNPPEINVLVLKSSFNK